MYHASNCAPHGFERKFHVWLSRSAAAIALLLFGAQQTAAQQDSFVFATPDQATDGSIEVIGAKSAKPEIWPATLIFKSAIGGCTATVVGPQAVLTAAHCIEDGASGQIKIHSQPIKAQCKRHPGYKNTNTTHDFALCNTDAPISGVAFEAVNTSIAFPKVAMPITILGYGCTTPGGFDRNFGMLFSGTATVTRLPRNDDLYTITHGGAAVCFGDSGGAAYVYDDAIQRHRLIVGVNSKGDISEVSYISSTDTEAFVSWAIDWSKQTKAFICGIHTEATGCRP
ncbi:S1 family peptidase [Mesorhizobium sp. WSM3860]|uniref:S1 family peptidase n=1 Tax=Mesorhizobium sp. WSM3860 TaxID=2029403 RepID=UPI000BAF8760|nr:S1 family peptidase [Mesorhizobium sp. WSM3860]PBC04260.1 hypothetical protein CK220_11630 [Mesorhizobium sp. WSM3860]